MRKEDASTEARNGISAPICCRVWERWRRHWAWGEVVFTGRRGGGVGGGGSLGRVGKDCVTGLLLSSDEWGKRKQGEAIFLLRREQRRIQLGPEGGIII